MKRLQAYSVIAILSLFLGFSIDAFSQTGINQTYVILDFNSETTHFEGETTAFNPQGAESFEGQYLGTFNPADAFELAGADIYTFQGTGDDVTAAELQYAIYPVGGTPTFSSAALDFCCESGDAICLDGVTACDVELGAGNKKWTLGSLGENILSGLNSGDYVIEVYFEATTSLGDRLDNNGGDNYKAIFTIGDEGFLDGDLTNGIVWSGETSNFSILDPTSLAGSGSNSNINGALVQNNQVLVSNASTGASVITTPSEMAYGTWQFSLATGENFNTTRRNGTKVYLTSNTDDVSKLKNGSQQDWQGYMVEFGNSFNNSMDTLSIVKVNGSTRTVIVGTSYPNTNNLFQGIRVKVTRDTDGNWELYAEEGFDGPAASVLRGTGTDNQFTTSSYFAMGTKMTSGAVSRRAYFDNISLIGGTSVSFATQSSERNENEGALTIDVLIDNPSAIDATTAEVTLVSGDADRVAAFGTQFITFPAGSSEPQQVTIEIINNNDCDLDAGLVFALQNVSGGQGSAMANLDEFSLRIIDDNSVSETDVMDDFEDGDLETWEGNLDSFSTEISGELSGIRTMFTDAVNTETGNVYLSYPNQAFDLLGGATTWNFSLQSGIKDPNNLNRFLIYLTSNASDPNDPEIDGYALGINAITTESSQDLADRIKLYRIDNGLATELISFEEAEGWAGGDKIAIQVTRDTNGLWELYLNEIADFGNLQFVGSVTDNTHGFMGDFIVQNFKGDDETDSTWENWSLSLDALSITQDFCSGVYETTGTGPATADIWRLVGTTTPATPPFNRFTDILVKDGDVLTLDANLRAKMVTVESNTELDLGEGDFDLEVFGDLTIDGVLTHRKGSITMSGLDGQQIVSGTSTPDFYEFNTENSNGVLFNTDAQFYGPIHAEAGVLDFNANDITLSSADFDSEILTGSISTIKPGADVLGEITMQRYVESMEDGYRIMAIPATSQTVNSAFNGDFLTTGFPGSDFPGQSFTNIKYYDENLPGDINFGFQDVQDSEEAINEDKAYWGYFPPGTANYVLDATGSFRKGDVTINLDYTDSGDPENDGWNCIPNPFPSCIDMASEEIVLVNCQRSAYILDHTLGGDWTGEYVSWVDGVSNNGGSNIISSYQGFFIKATGPGASITFKEGCKVDDQAAFLRNEDESRKIIRFALNDEDFGYETTISFHEEGTNAFDEEFDGNFITTTLVDQGIVSLASKLDDALYFINTVGELDEPVSIILQATMPQAGSYSIELTDLDNIGESVCVVIEDTETGTFTTMEEGTVINFEAPSNGYQTERFVVHFYPGAQVSAEMASCYGLEDGSITLQTPDYGNWNINWYDQDGILVTSEESVSTSILTDLASGNYTAVLTSEADYCTALEQQVAVFSPGEEIINYGTYLAECSYEVGQVAVNVLNSEEWTVTVFQDNLVVEENSGDEVVTVSGLAGEIYTVQVTTQCQTEEFTVDLTDANAVSAELEAMSELVLDGAAVPFTAVNLSDNALYSQWYVNDELVTENEDLTTEFSQAGVYEITLVSSNDNCSDQTTHVVTVSVVDGISEEELQFAILNGDNQVTLQFEEIMKGGQLNVTDAFGKLVISEQFSSSTEVIINTSDLAEGIYMITVSRNDEIVLTEKIFK